MFCNKEANIHTYFKENDNMTSEIHVTLLYCTICTSEHCQTRDVYFSPWPNGQRKKMGE